jgi:hypothetical protein
MRCQTKAQGRGQWHRHGKPLQRRVGASGKEHELHAHAAHATHTAHATHVRHTATSSFFFWRF